MSVSKKFTFSHSFLTRMEAGGRVIYHARKAYFVAGQLHSNGPSFSECESGEFMPIWFTRFLCPETGESFFLGRSKVLKKSDGGGGTGAATPRRGGDEMGCGVSFFDWNIGREIAVPWALRARELHLLPPPPPPPCVVRIREGEENSGLSAKKGVNMEKSQPFMFHGLSRHDSKHACRVLLNDVSTDTFWKNVTKMCPKCVQNMAKMCPNIENVQNVTKRCPKFGHMPKMWPKAAQILDICPKCDQKVP